MVVGANVQFLFLFVPVGSHGNQTSEQDIGSFSLDLILHQGFLAWRPVVIFAAA